VADCSVVHIDVDYSIERLIAEIQPVLGMDGTLIEDIKGGREGYDSPVYFYRARGSQCFLLESSAWMGDVGTGEDKYRFHVSIQYGDRTACARRLYKRLKACGAYAVGWQAIQVGQMEEEWHPSGYVPTYHIITKNMPVEILATCASSAEGIESVIGRLKAELSPAPMSDAELYAEGGYSYGVGLSYGLASSSYVRVFSFNADAGKRREERDARALQIFEELRKTPGYEVDIKEVIAARFFTFPWTQHQEETKDLFAGSE